MFRLLEGDKLSGYLWTRDLYRQRSFVVTATVAFPRIPSIAIIMAGTSVELVIVATVPSSGKVVAFNVDRCPLLTDGYFGLQEQIFSAGVELNLL